MKNGKKAKSNMMILVVLVALIEMVLAGCAGKGEAAGSAKAVVGKGGVLTIVDLPKELEGKYIEVDLYPSLERSERKSIDLVGLESISIKGEGKNREDMIEKMSVVKGGKAAIPLWKVTRNYYANGAEDEFVEFIVEKTTAERFDENFTADFIRVEIYNSDAEELIYGEKPIYEFNFGDSDSDDRVVFRNGSASISYKNRNQ